MVSVSTVSNITQINATNVSVATTSTVATTTGTSTAASTPTITNSNSSTVRVSAAALAAATSAVATTVPVSVADVLKPDYAPAANTVIKDSAAQIQANLRALSAISPAANIIGITLTDTTKATLTVPRTDVPDDLSSSSNTNAEVVLLKKITTAYNLSVTGLAASDALTLKSTGTSATLTMAVSDTAANIASNIDALQTKVKAKSIAVINLVADANQTTKPLLTITAKQLTADAGALATLNGDFDLTVTGVLAADALKTAGAADAILSKAGSKSTQSKITIEDKSANIVKNIATLETAATAGRLYSITVTDNTALNLTEAQALADADVLKVQFTSQTKLNITAMAAMDVVDPSGSVSDPVSRILVSGGNISLSSETVTDTAANISVNLDNIQAAVKGKMVTGITVSDKNPITVSGAAAVTGHTEALAAITNAYTLKVDRLSASDAINLKSPSTKGVLSLTVTDNAANIAANLDKLQALAKAKTLTSITINDSATPITITAAQLKSDPDALKLLANSSGIIVTGVAAADATKTAATSGVTNILVSDTSTNLVKNITALEGVATINKLTNITVSDGKALVLTEAQINSNSHFLATPFTSNTTVEATAVAVADVPSVQSRVNANANLTLTKESVIDTAANIQTNLDNLQVQLKAGGTTPTSNAKANPVISAIAVSDKGTITLTNSTLANDIDALKLLTGKHTLNVTDITVADAVTLKAPSKDATLAINVKDTAAATASNWDNLEKLAKSKTLASLAVTDSASSLLMMTAAQLKSDSDALNLVTGDYKLGVTGVAAADVTKTLTTKNIYSVEVKDTAANILKNLTSIQTAVTAAKIQNVVITDATNPSLSISDIFALTTTLPNVTLATGVKFNVKDTASTIIAHARDDIGDVLKNAGTVTITDKTLPNLTLADAITLKGIANLAAGTKYNVTDGGSVIATQAAIAGETILSGATSVTINKNFSISDAKAVTGIKTLAKGTVYSITDTANNILAQSAVSGDKILSGANTVIVADTSANIIAKLDQLEVLAKAGKITDIKFTDTPSAALSITQDQLIKDAEAIGKIISQRTLPVISVIKPTTPAPLVPIIPAMKTLSPWSAETTIGTIVDGSYQYRPYVRADRWGNMIADLVTPASTYNMGGQNQVSLYLIAQDGLGNMSTPQKVVDFKTSLGGPGTPRNGGIYLLKPNIYSASYTPNMVDNQLAIWMEQQSNNSYTMKYLPYAFSPALAASDTSVPALAVTGTVSSLVTGIDPNVVNFNWANYSSSNKFIMEYETLNQASPDQKDIYINLFSANGSGNNLSQNTTGAIPNGSNANAKLLLSGIKADAMTALYTAPDMSVHFARETTQGDQAGIAFTDLNTTLCELGTNNRFLSLGSVSDGIKANTLEFGVISNDPAVSTQTIGITAVTTTTPAVSPNAKPTYKLQIFKGDAGLTGTAGTSNLVATDSITLNNQVKAMWNQANIGNNTTLFSFQDGNVVHAVQVGSDGKIITDDQFSIPAGSTFDRYRPLGNTTSTMFEFFWREPIPGSTTGETTIKSRIYDIRGTAPLTLSANNSFNLLAGAAGNDTLTGHGNDVMSGGPGNDILTGLSGGKDIVSYLGKSTDYKITVDSVDPYKIIVSDLRSGSPDGTDILTNISAIRFLDKIVGLNKASTEKVLSQNFLIVNQGLTSAKSTNASGFLALVGNEAGTVSARIVSGYGNLPDNASALIDAISNASTSSAFKTAVLAAKTQGASSIPPFTLEILKTLTNPVDINVDGIKESGVQVLLDINTLSVSVGDVNLIPRSITSIPSWVGVSLNQNFFAVSGGTGLASGTSGANNSWIDRVPYNFNGTEQYTLRMSMGSRDGVSALPASALQLAANVAAASTPTIFDNALRALWDASYNGSYWVGLDARLANNVDINGDNRNETNVAVQMNYFGLSSNAAAINFSAVPTAARNTLTQNFLKITQGTAQAWGLIGNNNFNGSYTVTGQEAGTFNVVLNSVNYNPLPMDYAVKLAEISSATSIGAFASAVTSATNDNMAVGFYYALNDPVDLLGNGTKATNVGFNILYPQNPDVSASTLPFTPY